MVTVAVEGDPVKYDLAIPVDSDIKNQSAKPQQNPLLPKIEELLDIKPIPFDKDCDSEHLSQKTLKLLKVGRAKPSLRIAYFFEGASWKISQLSLKRSLMSNYLTMP